MTKIKGINAIERIDDIDEIEKTAPKK